VTAAPSDGRPARLAYLLAASHSGSTLLAMLLGAHPDIVTVGELKATNLGDPDRYRCSCGTLIRECGFWRDVSAAMAARGVPFDITRAGTDILSPPSPYLRRLLRPLHRGWAAERARDAALSLSPAWHAHLAHFQEVNGALVRCLGDLRGRKVVVDSSKVGMRLKYLLRNPALDVSVVRLVRDGRAVALTYMDPAHFADAKDPSLREGGKGGDRAAERLPMLAAAREWRRSNEEAEAILAGLPSSRALVIRYEDLCRDPSAVLDRVAAHLGLPALGDRWKLRGFEHHVVGNGMRLDTTTEVRLDERWRETLGPDDLAAFDSVAGAMNRRLGYA
jgi:hypothetical protein